MNLIQVMHEKDNMWIVVYKHEKLGPILSVKDINTGKHYLIQTNKEI